MDASAITAWIGAATGTVSLLLHVVNAWKGRIRLKVTPQVNDESPAGRKASRFSIRVTNPSPVPITVEQAFVVYDGEHREMKLDLEVGPGEGLPVQIGPREAVVLGLGMRAAVIGAFSTFRRAEVKTACGRAFASSRFTRYRGKSLKQILASAKSRR